MYAIVEVECINCKDINCWLAVSLRVSGMRIDGLDRRAGYRLLAMTGELFVIASDSDLLARVGWKSGFIAPSAVCWHSADNAGKKPPAHPPYAGCWIAASAGASSQ